MTHPRIGPIALGSSRWTDISMRDVTALLNAALSVGFTLIDTADVYGGARGFGHAEKLLGRALKQSPSLREDLVIGTKAGVSVGVPYDSSCDHLIKACDASLRRLGVDVIDLFQVHRRDWFTHPYEVASALTRLVSQGKIREAGISNYSPAEFLALRGFLPTLSCMSPEFSLTELTPLEDGTLEHAMSFDMTVLAWSPLAQGRLATGRGIPSPLLDRLNQLSEREGVEKSTIALSFLLAFPGNVVPILGTITPDRVVAAKRATSLRMGRADAYSLLQAAKGVVLP